MQGHLGRQVYSCCSVLLCHVVTVLTYKLQDWMISYLNGRCLIKKWLLLIYIIPEPGDIYHLW